MISKDFWKSKLFWLGVLQIAAAALEYIAGLPPETSIAQAISGILTIILRFATSQPISGTPAAKPK